MQHLILAKIRSETGGNKITSSAHDTHNLLNTEISSHPGQSERSTQPGDACVCHGVEQSTALPNQQDILHRQIIPLHLQAHLS